MSARPNLLPTSGALTLPRLSYGIDEASVASGRSRAFLYEQMKGGRRRFVKAGKRRLLREEDLRAFLDALATTT